MPLLRPLSALLPVALGLLLIAALACSPASRPKPTPPAAVPPQPTPLPAYAELQATAQGLLDDLRRAFATDDGALLAATISREITDLCSDEELQLWAEQGGNEAVEVEAAAIFLNLTDYRRTLLEIHTPESELLGAINIPMPMEREADGWRLRVPMFGVLPGECPFIPRGVALDDEWESGEGASVSPSDVPSIAGLPDFSPNVFAPPDGMVSGFGGSSASTADGAVYNFEVSAILRGEGTAAGIVEHYRTQWAGPDWETLDERSGGGAAWFIWKAPDADGHLWYGTLLAAPRADGGHSVLLTLQNSDGPAGP